jgi:hypothetical protein
LPDCVITLEICAELQWRSKVAAILEVRVLSMALLKRSGGSREVSLGRDEARRAPGWVGENTGEESLLQDEKHGTCQAYAGRG